MTIVPTSDIRMDAATNASAVDVARTRLRETAASRAEQAFDAAGVAIQRTTTPRAKTPETFVKFEAMVLQTFLQSMLPEDGAAVYGEGLAGQMWKSFLSKEIGTQMAKAGGIGIADRILGDFYLSGKTKVAVTGVSGDPKQVETDSQALLSEALVQEIQRNITKSISEDLAAQSRPSER